MGDIIQDNLKDILRISLPPPLELIISTPEKFSFSIDERGLNLYNSYLRENKGFKAFLNKLGLKAEYIDTILNVLKNGNISLTDLAGQIGMDLKVTAVIMRDLKLRGLVLMWF